MTDEEKILAEFFVKLSACRNLDDVKNLRNEISVRDLEGFLLPLTCSLDAVITGNSTIVETLLPELQVVADPIIEVLQHNFKFEYKSKPLSISEWKKYSYKPVYKLQN